MSSILRYFLLILFSGIVSCPVSAQSFYDEIFNSIGVEKATGGQTADDLPVAVSGGLRSALREALSKPWHPADSAAVDSLAADTVAIDTFVAYVDPVDTLIIIPTRYYSTLPNGYLGPIVFDSYRFLDPVVPGRRMREPETGAAFDWIDDLAFNNELIEHARQEYLVEYPDRVKYNQAWLPEPPKHYRSFVDPTTAKIVVEEIKVAPPTNPGEELGVGAERTHWLKTFNGSLHFSQAYISPNWYQGGNNNLNMIANILYNVKLNEKLHPNLMFETTIQYKLGVNNAPDDTVRNYNISEDLFQINSKFGLKAASRWYYSVNVAFKTQLLKNYKSNSNDLKAAFLSPGELNVGVGMTYNVSKPRYSFGASISPLSWNLKTCTNSRMNETAFGIDEGRNSVSQYGSSAECNFTWKIAYNITYRSRLFLFTDYSYVQGDWENTISFDINRFLTTQIYGHLRYDTSTDRMEDTRWHRFQFKEILSFGFSYKFSTI